MKKTENMCNIHQMIQTMALLNENGQEYSHSSRKKPKEGLMLNSCMKNIVEFRQEASMLQGARESCQRGCVMEPFEFLIVKKGERPLDFFVCATHEKCSSEKCSSEKCSSEKCSSEKCSSEKCSDRELLFLVDFFGGKKICVCMGGKFFPTPKKIITKSFFF